jgi:V/A-type H+-transporting ATPase subunit I
MVKIVEMKKMDLLLYHREQEKFLDELRDLGVVHITSEGTVTETVATQEIKVKLQAARRAAAILKRVQFEKNIPPSIVVTEDVPKMLVRFEECDTKRERYEQEFEALKKDNITLAPWGNFDPRVVKRLAEAGVGMKFYTIPEKDFAAFDKSNMIVETIAVTDGTVRFAVVFSGEAPEIAGAEEVRLPDISLKDLNAKVIALELRRAEVSSDIDTMASHVSDVEKYCAELQNDQRFEQARMSMAAEVDGKLYRLSGWLPKQNEAKVAAFLDKYSACVAFRDPTEADAVPIHIKSGPISKFFEPILKLYTLPNYRELNFAPLVAPFFIFFFGLCLGDVGYGAIVFLGALIALWKVGPKMKPFMMLGVIFGISTMLSGVLLNGFFGEPIFGGESPVYVAGEQVVGVGGEAGKGLFSDSGVTVSILAPVTVGNDKVFPAMALALVIGFVQMFFGMFVKSYLGMKHGGFVAGLEPLALISLAAGAVILGAQTDFMALGINTFAVGRYNIGALLVTIPAWASQAMVYGGILLLLLTNNLNKKIYMRPLSGLWALYNFSTGFLSNILSYLRLFALGLAGGLLGAAVNQVAFMVRDAASEGILAIVGIAGMVLIMLGGHALNLALAALSSFVHPLRLTFVEFYGAVGFEGGGKPYVPFAKVEN